MTRPLTHDEAFERLDVVDNIERESVETLEGLVMRERAGHAPSSRNTASLSRSLSNANRIRVFTVPSG